MSYWAKLRVPAQQEMLVGIYETHWLTQYAEKTGSLDTVLSVMAGYFASTGQIIAEAGGKLIKTMGMPGWSFFQET